MLASSVLGRLTANAGGGVTCSGGLIATGLTIDPGGIDVMQVSTFRNNLTVQGVLFAPGGLTAAQWVTDTAAADQQDLASTLAMSGATQSYRFDFYITQNGAGAPDFTLQPNEDATDTDATQLGRVAGGTNSFFDETQWFTGGGFPAGSRMRGHGAITQLGGVATIGYYLEVDDGSGVWKEKGFWVGNYYGGTITGLRIHSTGATSIGIGSVLRVAAFS